MMVDRDKKILRNCTVSPMGAGDWTKRQRCHTAW